MHPQAKRRRSSWPRYAVMVVALGLLFVGARGLGIPLPWETAESDATTPAKNVPIEDAQPCERNDSPRINLDSNKRIEACVKAKEYALAELTERGDADQFACLDNLWENESAWSAWAINTDSGAYGIAQALGHGHVYDVGDWKAQVDWGLKYIYKWSGNFDTPCEAWAWWQRTDPRPHPGHWY